MSASRIVFIEVTTRLPLSRVLAAIEKLPGIEKVALEAEGPAAGRAPKAIAGENGSMKLLSGPTGKRERTEHPQLVYVKEGNKTLLDVEQSLAAISMSKGDVLRKKWPRGSPQHSIKSAIKQRLRHAKAA